MPTNHGIQNVRAPLGSDGLGEIVNSVYFYIELCSESCLLKIVQLREDVMFTIAAERAHVVRSRSGLHDLPDAPEYLTGFIESVRRGGLRLAGYEAWAAVACGLIAVACLVGAARLAVALINPIMNAVVPMNCGSSIDCAMQTMGMLP
jgi:hypothetical protein